jgi:hypothetical protein
MIPVINRLKWIKHVKKDDTKAVKIIRIMKHKIKEED